ncbi:MAG: hypothetical protein ACHRHE_07045 [Tepidisphaerales bacterium]
MTESAGWQPAPKHHSEQREESPRAHARTVQVERFPHSRAEMLRFALHDEGRHSEQREESPRAHARTVQVQRFPYSRAEMLRFALHDDPPTSVDYVMDSHALTSPATSVRIRGLTLAREAAVMGRIGFAVIFLAALAGWSAAQPVTQPAPTPPDRVIVIQKGAPVSVLGFSEDGKSIYIHAEVEQANVWGLMVYYWPEAAAGIVALLALRWLIRVARTKQYPGEQHCRRCNYLLKGLLSGRCPECGTELSARNRVAGRRRWPRVVMALAVLVVVVGGYLWGNWHAPRTGSPSEWFDWRSMRLAEWGMANNRHWIARHIRTDQVVFLAEIGQGGASRKICRLPLERGKIEHFCGAMLSGDRKSIFCEMKCDSRFKVAAIDLASGKVVRQSGGLDEILGSYASEYGPWRGLFVSSDSGSWRTVFVVSYLIASRSCALRATDFRTGKRLNELPISSTAEVYVLATPTRDLAVVADSGENSPVTSVTVWDPVLDQIVKSFRVEGGFCCCDDGKLYAARGDGVDLVIETWDILTGQRTSSVKLAGARPGRPTVRNGMLVVPPFWSGEEIPPPFEVLALNLKTGVRKSLAAPADLGICLRLNLSPDGRRMAVTDSMLFATDKVHVYDLP